LNGGDYVKGARKESLAMLKPAYKLWLETIEGYVFGRRTLELLQKI